MLDRTIVAFDIETIPDPDVGRRLSLEGEDVAVVRQMLELRAGRSCAGTVSMSRHPEPYPSVGALREKREP